MINAVAVIVVAAAWLPLAMYYAWALQTLWNWYAPAIFGLPVISYGAAFGIGLVTQFLTRSIPKVNSGSSFSDGAWDFAGIISRPLLAVGAGWVYLKLWPLS